MTSKTLVAVLGLFLLLGLFPAAESQVLPRDGPGFYHTWATLTKDLEDLAKAYPGKTKLYSIGKGSLGLDLWMLEVTDFDKAYPPLESRTRVYLDGGTHGNEQLGTEAAFEVILFLLKDSATNATARWMLENQHYFIVPMVNTDGNVLNSRTNAKQVNINRNFPVGWDREGASDTPGGNYRGPYPASEPETRAVMAAIDRVKPDYSNSFHTGTVMFLHPWGGYTEENPDNDTYAAVCMGIDDPATPCGPIYYTIYPAGGTTCDYAYWSVGANSWTFETSNDQGDYFNATGDVRGAIYETWNALMWTLPRAHLLGGHITLVEKTILGTGAEAAMALVLKNDGLGRARNVTVALSNSVNADSRVIFVPELESGETASIDIPVGGAATDGAAFDLSVDYEERAFRRPMGRLKAVFGVSAGTDGLQLVDLLGTVAADPPLSELGAQPSRVPGFEPLLLVGLSVLVGLSRRRLQ